MDEHARKLARNEVVFREVNEEVRKAAGGHGPRDGHLYSFFCECSNRDCTLQVEVTTGEYEQVRADPLLFLVVPEHDLPAIEEVVARSPRYWVVRKQGEGAEIAAESDPR
jgi:hypothetical protein